MVFFWYKDGAYNGNAYFGLGGSIENQRVALSRGKFRLPEKCVACGPEEIMIAGVCYFNEWDQ